MAKNTTPEFVLRPFEGIAGEPDLVALREVVPAATAVARTTKEYGSREITFTTVLPGGWPALHRTDGTVFVALQTNAGSGVAGDVLGVVLAAVVDHEDEVDVRDGFGGSDGRGDAPGLVLGRDDHGDPLARPVTVAQLRRRRFRAPHVREDLVGAVFRLRCCVLGHWLTHHGANPSRPPGPSPHRRPRPTLTSHPHR